MPRIPSRTGIRSPEGAGLFDSAAAATSGKPEEIDKTESDILIKSQVQNWGARSRVPPSNLLQPAPAYAVTLAIEPNMERAKGVEPLPETWRAPILPVKLHPHDGFTQATRLSAIPHSFISMISFGSYVLCIPSGIQAAVSSHRWRLAG